MQPLRSAAAAAAASPAHTDTRFEAVDRLFAEFKAVPDTNDPQQKALNKATKLAKLEQAYALCLPLTKTQETKQQGMTRLAMILGEYGIMHYAVMPNFPGRSIPDGADFMLSKQLLLGALNAYLVTLDANSLELSYSADLKGLAETLVFHPSYDEVTLHFSHNSKEALLQKIHDAPFTNEQRLHLARMLRYLNGSERNVRGYKLEHLEKEQGRLIQQRTAVEQTILKAVDDRLNLEMGVDADPGYSVEADLDMGVEADKPEQQKRKLDQSLLILAAEKRVVALELRTVEVERQTHAKTEDMYKLFTINALYMARELANCDKNEGWEVIYNDWVDAMKAEGTWTPANATEEKHKLGQWLLDNATNDSQRARVYNKFFYEADGVRKSLNQCLTILQRAMSPSDYQTLERILKGEIVDQATIEGMARILHGLDLSQHGNLTIDWFAIIPSNLAHRLMNENSSNTKEIEGLIKLAVALVHPHIRESGQHVNYSAIMNNLNMFYLYNIAPQTKKATTLLKEVGTTLQGLSGDNTNNRRLLAEARQKAEEAREIFKQAATQISPTAPDSARLTFAALSQPADIILAQITHLEQMAR